MLKIEFIRNVKFNPHTLINYKYGVIETPTNILPKKLKAVLWRDDVEDIYDIVYMSQNYSFNWAEDYSRFEPLANFKLKDIKKRIATHPTGKIKAATWLKTRFDSVEFKKTLKQIAMDFESGADNSLGKSKIAIELAKPLIEFQS